MDLDHAQRTAARLMPSLLGELATLVAVPSVSSPAFPAEPVLQMGNETVEFLKRSGATDVRLIDIPHGYPSVYAEIPGPEGAPTVLCYAHYDVQPAPVDQGWDTDPFVATQKEDGRIYGRGAADDKSGVIIHGGVLQAFDGAPPVTMKILIEGEEESASHLEDFVKENPELVQCDAFIVADMGNPQVGQPALTTALRGEASCILTVSTFDRPLHSGLFGGAVPDALVGLIKLLATLHDDEGNTVVPGLQGFDWPGADVTEEDLRANAGLPDDVSLVGSGTIATRLWSRPSVTVIGMDVPSVAEASNILHPVARARLSLRVPPGANAEQELRILTEHLRTNAPWNVRVGIEPLRTGEPFAIDESHPFIAAASEALTAAYDRPAETIGSGGSIPLIAALHEAAPNAAVVLWGAEDTAQARIHASNESVDPAEIERTIVAQMLLIDRIANS